MKYYNGQMFAWLLSKLRTSICAYKIPPKVIKNVVHYLNSIIVLIYKWISRDVCETMQYYMYVGTIYIYVHVYIYTLIKRQSRDLFM